MALRRRTIVIALVAAAALAAALYFGAGFALERGRRLAERRASALSGATVRIGRLGVSWFPPTVVLSDVDASRLGNRGSSGEVAVDVVRVRGALGVLAGLRSGPLKVTIERPRITLTLAKGRLETPGAGSEAIAGLLAAAPAGTSVEVLDAEAEVGPLRGWSATMKGLRGEARRSAGADTVTGRIEFPGGRLSGPGVAWEPLRGEAVFTIDADGVHLQPLAIHADSAALTWRGTVRSGGAEGPAAEGDLEAAMDVASAAALFPTGTAPGGRVATRLSLTLAGGSLRAQGDVDAVGLVLHGVPIDNLRADLRVDDRVHLTGIRAHLLGGEATGTVEIGSERDRRVAQIDLRLDGIDIAQVLGHAGWTGPPLRGTLHYRGQHQVDDSGLATLRGSGVLDGVGHYVAPGGADLPLEVTTGVVTEGESIRLERGTLRAGSTRAGFSGVVTRDGGVRLRLRGATGDISEILPLFAAPGAPARSAGPKAPAAAPSAPPQSPTSPSPAPSPLPAPSPSPSSSPSPSPSPAPAPQERSAAFAFAPAAVLPARRGFISGGAVAAVLRQPGAASVFAAPPARAAAPKRSEARAGAAGGAKDDALTSITRALGGLWEWDGDLVYGSAGLSFTGRLKGKGLTYRATVIGDLETTVAYHDGRLRIEQGFFRHPGGGEARLSGQILFQAPGFVAVTIAAERYALEPAVALSGIDLPIAGTWTGRLALSGRPSAVSGGVTIEAGAVSVADVGFDDLHGAIIFTPEFIDVRALTLAQAEGKIVVAGQLLRAGPEAEPEAESSPGLTIEGQDLDLSRWAPEAGALALAGRLEIHGALTGSLERPDGTVAVRASGVSAGGAPVGEVTAALSLRDGRTRFSGAVPDRHVRFEGELGPGGRAALLRASVFFDGTVVRADEVDPGAPSDATLTLAGRADLEARRGALLAGTLRLATLRLSAAGLDLAADREVEARLESGRLLVAGLTLVGEGTRVDIRADAAVLRDGPVSVEARGSVDLRLLRLVLVDLQVTGRADIALALEGSRSHPRMQGTLAVDAPGLRHPDLPFPVTDLRAHAGFADDRLEFTDLAFLAGGGPVTGAGAIVFGGEAAAGGRGAAIARADLRFHGTGVRSSFPEGFRSVSDFDLALERAAGSTTLHGTVDLVRGVYGRDFNLERGLAPRPPAGLFDITPPQGPLATVALDIRLQADSDVWIRNDFGRIEGQGALRVGGTAARPTVAGRITAIEGGTIEFRNVRYRLERGTVDFDDPEVINPLFDLQAQTEVAAYRITLGIEGRLDDFRFDLASDPPLPQPDIVALLLTGRTLGTLEVGSGSAGLAEDTVTSYLAGTLTEGLTEALSTRSGLDVVTIDPLQISAQGDPAARVTIGKAVSPDLFVTYSNVLGSNQGAIYQLDYALRRDVHFTSVRDRDGSLGGDFKLVFRSPPPAPDEAARAAEPLIEAVRLEGDLKFEPRRVRRILRVREGGRRSRAAISESVERLLAFYRRRGFLTAEIDDTLDSPAGGAASLLVRVKAGPRIELEVHGTSFDGALKRVVETAWQNGVFADDLVDEARDDLVTALADRGYPRPAIDAVVEETAPGALRVVLRIDPGRRSRAAIVRVEGARQISAAEVLAVVRTRPDGLFSRGIVRATQLREDVRAVHDLYRRRGFPDATVAAPEILPGPRGRDLVVFRVDEGARVVIRDLQFQGNETFDAAWLRHVAALPPGTPFVEAEVDAALVRLRRAYDDAGYPDVRIRSRRVGVGGNGDLRREDLLITVREGLRQEVGPIAVTGNVLTRDGVIRKALTVRPGDPLSRSDLLASQTRLYGRGIFRSVAVEAVAPAATPGTPDGAAEPGEGPGTAPEATPAAVLPDAGSAMEEPITRPVLVTVNEAGPLTQVIGLGYDSEEKARGQYEISHRNLLGTGRSLGLQTRASTLEQRAALAFREKGLFGGRYDALASTFVEEERLPAFDVRTLGASIQFSRQFTRATRTLYRYSLRDVDLSDAAASFEGTTLRLSGVAASAVHDTRDALFNPRRGHYIGGEAQYYGQGLGSEADFTKLYAQLYFFKEILPGTIWAQALRAGAGIPQGRSRRDPLLTGDLISGLPPSERFFAGGDTTVRGFRRDRLGRRDDPGTTADDGTATLETGGDPIGGEGLFLINEELRFPIFRLLQGVVFYDVGNIYRTLADYDVTDLRHVAGAGLRIATPIGPFRLEYGALLDRREDERRGELFLSIGQAF